MAKFIYLYYKFCNMKSVVISVRIPRRLKEEAERLGVKVSEVARKAVEKEIEKLMMEERRKAAKELGEFFSRKPIEEWVKSIRESREAR